MWPRALLPSLVLAALAACGSPPAPVPLPTPLGAEELALLDEWRAVFEALQSHSSDAEPEYDFPDAWDGVTSHGALSVKERRTRATRKRLAAARTTVRFDDVDLGDVAEFLSRISGTQIVVLPAARESRSRDELRVTLRLEHPESVDKLLDLVTTFRGLAWKIDGERIVISTPESVRGLMDVRLYDVKDLVQLMQCCSFADDISAGDATGEWCDACQFDEFED